MTGPQYAGMLVAIGVCGAVVGFCTAKASSTLGRAVDQYRWPMPSEWLLVLGLLALSTIVCMAAMVGLPWDAFWAHLGRLWRHAR